MEVVEARINSIPVEEIGKSEDMLFSKMNVLHSSVARYYCYM
ncbi:hypothetical protein ACIQZM_18320 [Peribacillus sp. NPDC097206]